MLLLEVGDVVEVTADIDLEPHGVIKKGEHGVVVFATDDGRADIKMACKHEGLADWDNCIWLIPPHTDLVMFSLKVVENIHRMEPIFG